MGKVMGRVCCRLETEGVVGDGYRLEGCSVVVVLAAIVKDSVYLNIQIHRISSSDRLYVERDKINKQY